MTYEGERRVVGVVLADLLAEVVGEDVFVDVLAGSRVSAGVFAEEIGEALNLAFANLWTISLEMERWLKAACSTNHALRSGGNRTGVGLGLTLLLLLVVSWSSWPCLVRDCACL